MGTCRRVDTSPVAQGCPRGLKLRVQYESHTSFDRLLAKVLAVVPRHQNFDAVNELLRGLRVGADDLVFLHQVNGDAELVDSGIVREVPVQTVRLFYQDRAACPRMLLQAGEHLAEIGSTACLGRFDIGEFVGNRKTVTRGVVA